jgi:proline dehydrogenase
MFLKEDSLVEKLVYRLIKKHVAGTTMNSAIEKAQRFNKENIHSSIMFLSGTADSKAKARYVTTTYTELIRRISRMGLKASVHIPVSQIGGLVDNELAANNLLEIINTGNRYGVFVWAAINGNVAEASVAKRFKHFKGFGIAAPHEKADELVNKWHVKAVKLIFDGKEKEGIEKLKGEVELVARGTRTAVFSFPPEKLIRALASSKYKKSLVFEFGLGYSSRKVKRLVARGGVASVNVPFGKDWTSYAMDIVPEGKTHFLIENLLREGERQVV